MGEGEGVLREPPHSMRSVNYRLLMLPVIKGEGGGAPVAHGWSHLHQPRPITDGIDAALELVKIKTFKKFGK